MKRIIRTPLCLIATICLLAAGCTVGPDYQRPTVNTPDAFRGAATQPAIKTSLGDLTWWEAFDDPTLQRLIRTALANNYDLRVAITRIDQANAVRMQAASQGLPQVGYTGTAATGRNSFLGSPRPREQVRLPNGDTLGPDPNQDSFLAALSVAWEIDIWGRVRRMKEAALAQYLASEEARRAIGVTLIAQVAQTYFKLLELDQQLEIAVSTDANLRKSLDLFTRKFEGGAGSQLEVQKATASQAQVAATIPEIERQIALQENQLRILLGENPGPIARGKAKLTEIKPPEIPVGLPSELLERRPDVRQAEAQVRAANAQVGVAKASFFPKIGLSAMYGAISNDLSSITSASSETSSIGASLTGPIFAGGALVGQYKQDKALWEQARLQYQQTALTAFREVADALTSRQKIAQVIVQQQRAVDAAAKCVDLSNERYETGKSAYFEVLDAQTQLYSSQNALAEAQYNQLNAYIQLYKALGGGWAATDPPPATQPAR